MDDAKVPYDKRLRLKPQDDEPVSLSKYAWVHHCCYFWICSELKKQKPEM